MLAHITGGGGGSEANKDDSKEALDSFNIFLLRLLDTMWKLCK